MAKLFATKPLSTLMNEAQETGEHSLKRTLGPVNLILLGIGAIIGAGLFVRTAAAIADRSGPSVVIAFMVAGIGCALAGLCYAEFSSMIPVAGSAYTYSYATMGELVAWIIGWDLVLEYAVGAATVAIGWSEFFNRVLSWFGLAIPYQWIHSPLQVEAETGIRGLINLPAIFILLLLSALLIKGTKESAMVNGVIVDGWIFPKPPAEVFATAQTGEGRDKPTPCYEVLTIGLSNQPFVAESGIVFAPQKTLKTAPALDTLIIPGGKGLRIPHISRLVSAFVKAR